jgi:NAD(P)-dependent dehydrogenase (short-subunit alcohol dehydrogenase family)
VPLPGDITSQDSLKAIADRVRQEVGYINLLIANAGVTGPMLESLKPRYTLSDFVAHAWSSSMEEFNATYGTNCTALFYTILAFLELLDEGNKRKNYLKSQVIATASTASFLRNPRAGFAYLSSKAADISLIKSLSTFCVPWGIRFNAIAAGCTGCHTHYSIPPFIPLHKT